MQADAGGLLDRSLHPLSSVRTFSHLGAICLLGKASWKTCKTSLGKGRAKEKGSAQVGSVALESDGSWPQHWALRTVSSLSNPAANEATPLFWVLPSTDLMKVK